MTVEKRPYRMKRRAEMEARTRRRITESTVELHGTVGPARTSISAIAQRAGVRRSTVYRHFPDEESLFAACSAHWRAANPFPDLESWAAIADPDRRLAAALEELYAFYGRAGAMIENLLRDEAAMPIVGRLLGSGYHAYFGAARDALLRGRRARGIQRQRVAAAIGHALSFGTWRSLTSEQGLEGRQAAQLMCKLVGAAASEGRRPAPTDPAPSAG